MNPFQAIAFTWRSFIQSRRLQRQETSTGLLEGTWYESEQERYADEVGELIAQDLGGIKIDTRHRKLVFKKNVRLGLHKTLKRLQSKHRDVDWQVLESELLYWVEQNSEPEGDGLGFTQQQMDRHSEMIEDWFDDYHRKASEKPQTA